MKSVFQKVCCKSGFQQRCLNKKCLIFHVFERGWRGGFKGFQRGVQRGSQKGRFVAKRRFVREVGQIGSLTKKRGCQKRVGDEEKREVSKGRRLGKFVKMPSSSQSVPPVSHHEGFKLCNCTRQKQNLKLMSSTATGETFNCERCVLGWGEQRSRDTTLPHVPCQTMMYECDHCHEKVVKTGNCYRDGLGLRGSTTCVLSFWACPKQKPQH